MISESSHSSLPIEYQLQYGTACGDLDLSQVVNNAPNFGITSANGCFPEEVLLCGFGSDASPLAVHGHNSGLVGFDRS